MSTRNISYLTFAISILNFILFLLICFKLEIQIVEILVKIVVWFCLVWFVTVAILYSVYKICSKIISYVINKLY